jgi:BirA family biotin operon repressor/biotin-[acetyl-CoA-carboxylase] ligase
MIDSELDISAIRGSLKTRSFGQGIHHTISVPSTNDVARQLAEAGQPEGTVVCAEEQTAGRGRMERTWVAPPYSSILMSIIVRPSVSLKHLGRLGMAFGLGLADAVQNETGLIALLKWPNDLMINGKKCAGMLSEAAFLGERVEHIVLGIGLNVNLNAASLTGALVQATSIADELGHPFSREVLIASILNHSERYYTRLVGGEDLSEMWSSRCVTLNREICATTPWGEERGLAEAVDENGALLLRRADGSLATLSAADVSLSSS